MSNSTLFCQREYRKCQNVIFTQQYSPLNSLLYVRNVEVEAPFDFDGVTHGKHFTNLDTTGRYQVTLDKSNVVYEHEQFIQVESCCNIRYQ
jgi:hypothetical protein